MAANGGPVAGAQAQMAGLGINGGGAANGAMVAVGEAHSVLPAPDLSAVQSVDTHTKALGIIQPPPDIRAIIDKAASFVARNGEHPVITRPHNMSKDEATVRTTHFCTILQVDPGRLLHCRALL